MLKKTNTNAAAVTEMTEKRYISFYGQVDGADKEEMFNTELLPRLLKDFGIDEKTIKSVVKYRPELLEALKYNSIRTTGNIDKESLYQYVRTSIAAIQEYSRLIKNGDGPVQKECAKARKEEKRAERRAEKQAERTTIVDRQKADKVTPKKMGRFVEAVINSPKNVHDPAYVKKERIMNALKTILTTEELQALGVNNKSDRQTLVDALLYAHAKLCGLDTELYTDDNNGTMEITLSCNAAEKKQYWNWMMSRGKGSGYAQLFDTKDAAYQLFNGDCYLFHNKKRNVRICIGHDAFLDVKEEGNVSEESAEDAEIAALMADAEELAAMEAMVEEESVVKKSKKKEVKKNSKTSSDAFVGLAEKHPEEKFFFGVVTPGVKDFTSDEYVRKTVQKLGGSGAKADVIKDNCIHVVNDKEQEFTMTMTANLSKEAERMIHARKLYLGKRIACHEVKTIERFENIRKSLNADTMISSRNIIFTFKGTFDCGEYALHDGDGYIITYREDKDIFCLCIYTGKEPYQKGLARIKTQKEYEAEKAKEARETKLKTEFDTPQDELLSADVDNLGEFDEEKADEELEELQKDLDDIENKVNAGEMGAEQASDEAAEAGDKASAKARKNIAKSFNTLSEVIGIKAFNDILADAAALPLGERLSAIHQGIKERNAELEAAWTLKGKEGQEARRRFHEGMFVLDRAISTLQGIVVKISNFIKEVLGIIYDIMPVILKKVMGAVGWLISKALKAVQYISDWVTAFIKCAVVTVINCIKELINKLKDKFLKK